MDEHAAYIRLSLTEGTFEIKGSEAFVAAQAERFEALIHELLQTKPEALLPRTEETPAQQNKSDAQQHPEQLYPRVFATAGEGFQITAKVPGTNNAEKTANIALLLALAEVLRGGTGVSASAVQQAAKDHACLDAGNFKAGFKKRKTLFVLDGGAQTYEIRLTHPGREKAKELAETLNAV